MEDPENGVFDFWTASETSLAQRATPCHLVLMADRGDWVGTPEEMLEAFSKYRDPSHATGLGPILAGVGLFIAMAAC